MIAIAKTDRDVLRFLWVRDIEEQSPNIIVLRYTRVIFGVACSPFLLNGNCTTSRGEISRHKPICCNEVVTVNIL